MIARKIGYPKLLGDTARYDKFYTSSYFRKINQSAGTPGIFILDQNSFNFLWNSSPGDHDQEGRQYLQLTAVGIDLRPEIFPQQDFQEFGKFRVESGVTARNTDPAKPLLQGPQLHDYLVSGKKPVQPDAGPRGGYGKKDRGICSRQGIAHLRKCKKFRQPKQGKKIPRD